MAEYVFPIPNYTGNPGASYHSPGATDLSAPKGTPVRNVASGVVKNTSYYPSSGGYTVTVKGDDNRDYYYAHLNGPASVRIGQRVESGFQLGEVGDSGNAAGNPHLHIGIGYGILSGTGSSGGTGINFNAKEFLTRLLQGGAQAITDAVGDIVGGVGTGNVAAGLGGALVPQGLGGVPSDWLAKILAFGESIITWLKDAFIYGATESTAPILFLVIGIIAVVLGLVGMVMKSDTFQDVASEAAVVRRVATRGI